MVGAIHRKRVRFSHLKFSALAPLGRLVKLNGQLCAGLAEGKNQFEFPYSLSVLEINGIMRVVIRFACIIMWFLFRRIKRVAV